MSKSFAEMEDAEKFPHESESKSLASDVDRKGEFYPSESTSDNAKKTENGGEDLNKFADAAECKAIVNSEVEDQIHPNREAVEPMDADHFQAFLQVMPGQGPVGELIKDNCENIDPACAETKGEKQTGAGDAVEKRTDTNNENVKQKTSTGGLKEVQFPDNGLESENHVKNMEGKPTVDIVDKMLKESNRVDRDSVEHVAQEDNTTGTDDACNLPADTSDNRADQSQSALLDEIPRSDDNEMEDAANSNEDETVTEELKEQGKETSVASPVTGWKDNTVETSAKYGTDVFSHPNQHEPVTPNSHVRYSPAKDGYHSGQAVKSAFTRAILPPMAEGDDGTPEEQMAFMKELDNFYRERAMVFKPPKFYGQPLNCLKLWRSVIRLGGYEKVTGSKLWRQVGESFHPPKTCTTVSWTFRIFYEKSLLEFERHKRQCGELQLPLATLHEASGVEHEVLGQGTVSISGRSRRDAAARAMQGWHVQQIFDNGEDKNPNNTTKREKNIKSIGSIKHKRPNEVENSVKVARTEDYKQLVTSVVDVGPPADWVKINIRQTKDCFEVYALVPGLLREEVRVQSDPAGRLVITGQPEQVDNPWGITPFKKVVSLPARIDPLQTSAVVSLHGRLFVRVPFEQPNI